MVTSQNMAGSLVLSALPPGWCHYMEAGDKTEGERVAEIWREAWGEGPTGEGESQKKKRRQRQEREEREWEDGHQLGEEDLEERGERTEGLKQPRTFKTSL